MKKHKWIQRSLLLLIILCAVWLRWWQLDNLPPGLWYDEAYNAMDAVWMLDTGSPQIFFWGNNGREPVYLYLVALGMVFLEAKAFTLRWVSSLAGIIAVPLIYRWGITLFRGHPRRDWLALFAAAGLAFSFWHLVMSRTGFRTVLLPVFVIGTGYYFWLGIKRRRQEYFITAGIILGVGQYTYLSARFLPLWLGLFVFAATVLAMASRRPEQRLSVRNLWLGLLVTALISIIVFLPLGRYFLINADRFMHRAGEVFFWVEIEAGELTLKEHLLNAVSVFAGGYDGNWRHDLPGHAAFGWLMIGGFWAGLITSLFRFRQSEYLFLMIGLLVLWVPGLLSVPAPHALRLSGMLPFYYLIAAIGLINLARLIGTRALSAQTVCYIIFGLIVFVNGGLTGYDYFGRWANDPNVYYEYDGHIADLAQFLIDQAAEKDVLMPFVAYEHPATRLFLHDYFQETSTPPSDVPGRDALLVEPTEALARRSNAVSYVWLTKDRTGQGVVYIPPQMWDEQPATMKTGQQTDFTSPYSTTALAIITPIENIGRMKRQFESSPDLVSLNYGWENKALLAGYRVLPEDVLPGYSLDVRLFWKMLRSGFDWNYDVAVEMKDIAGNPVGRSEFSARELFNWRQSGTEISSQHLFFVSSELPPGVYVLHFRIEDPQGQPMPIEVSGQTVPTAPLGVFYVVNEDVDPRQPPVPLNVVFEDTVVLKGYAPPLPLGNNVFRGKLFWQVAEDVARDYDPFVHLIDETGQAVSQWSAPPLAGQYPTSLWKPGEIIVDDFDMILPEGLPSGRYRLVVGLTDTNTGVSAQIEDPSEEVHPNKFWVLEVINIP